MTTRHIRAYAHKHAQLSTRIPVHIRHPNAWYHTSVNVVRKWYIVAICICSEHMCEMRFVYVRSRLCDFCNLELGVMDFCYFSDTSTIINSVQMQITPDGMLHGESKLHNLSAKNKSMSIFVNNTVVEILYWSEESILFGDYHIFVALFHQICQWRWYKTLWSVDECFSFLTVCKSMV